MKKNLQKKMKYKYKIQNINFRILLDQEYILMKMELLLKL